MMVERSKSWIKENFMEIVLACMFTAFWVQYNEDQKEAAQFRDFHTYESRIENSKMQTLSRILRDDPDTDEDDKDLLTEFIKGTTRSGSVSANSQK